jgi:HlyD family secretion protein
MSPPLRRTLLAAIALAAAVLLGWALLRPAAVPAEAAAADTGPVRVTVDWTGKTRVRDRYTVAAPVSGELLRSALDAGDAVRAGAVVARLGGAAATPLDARTHAELSARLAAARAAVGEAQAGLSRARAAEAQAAREEGRARALADQGAQAAQETEAVQAAAAVRAEERRMAEGALERARAEEGAVRAALEAGGQARSLVEVRSPVDGVVLRLLRESAGPVAAGTPLLEIGDPSRLEVVLDLPTADAARIRAGLPARITGWGGGPLQAVVRRVEPSAYTKVSPLGVEEQRVDVLLDPVGTGWNGLGDGFAVDAQVVIEEVPQALRVPTSALFRDGAGWAVYRAEHGRARRLAVEVLARGGGAAALRQGLEPGDLVLVHPGDRVEDGGRIRLR